MTNYKYGDYLGEVRTTSCDPIGFCPDMRHPYGCESEQVDEVRTVSATGGAKGVKIARYDQIPPSVLRELAEHWGRGGEKYGHGNWRKGFEWWKSYRSAMGHLTEFWDGKDYDEETGSKHVIAAAWHCLALAWYMDNMPEYDTSETFRHHNGIRTEKPYDRTWSDSDDR